MATYLSLVNSVLRRLREDTVVTYNETDYSTLIGDLVNETKREVEDAWKWRALLKSYSLSIVQGTQAYSLTNSGDRWRFSSTNNVVWNDTNEYWLKQPSHTFMFQSLNTTHDQGRPSYFGVATPDANGDGRLNFYPIPDASYTFIVTTITPQADLAAGDTVLVVPEYPVILGAYAKAIAERGEDDGRAHGEAIANYNKALGDAIAFDESITRGETTWYA